MITRQEPTMITRRDLLGAVSTIAFVGLAGCAGQAAEPGNDCEKLPTEPDYKGWLDDVETYDGTCDARGQDPVTVVVGARGKEAYWEFAPAAVAVSPGTTVVWEWSGKGGGHDVVSEHGTFDSGRPHSEAGTRFEHTFAAPGVYRYYCTPHKRAGMKGAIFVTVE